MRERGQEVVEPMNEEAGPRWSFFRVRRIRGRDGSTYLWRLYILSTPWFGVMLHRIFRPDNQRDLHDHPWNFLSVILLGWYSESYQRGKSETKDARRSFFRWNYKRADDRHSIRVVGRVPVWTLVFTGVRRRKWGFWVENECSCPSPFGEESYHLRSCCTISDLFEFKHRFIPYDQYEKLNDA